MMHAPLHDNKMWTTAEINDVATIVARTDFLAFRRQIRPHMLVGWWIEEVADHLQQFYEEMMAGNRPKLAITAPPQSGKSWTITDFIAYVAGRNPERKTIFGSYSDDLGIRTNLDLQRIFVSEQFQKIFPKTRISEEAVVSGGFDRWKRNSSLIEYIDQPGSFRNTTVSGQINGMELHLGVIDDPLKGRAEAHSPTMRNKTWEWFADDFLSRFAGDLGFSDKEATQNKRDWKRNQFKGWARLAVAWAADLAPYQSPTYRAISISTKDDSRKDRGTTVLHTIEQVKEQLLLRGVSPDQFARALMQKPKLLEHDEDKGESDDD